jgi:histidine triad (HIT) family protein
LPISDPGGGIRAPKPCPFCAIVSGGQASFSVYADAVSVAFLDHRPLLPGHVLLVPRGHYATLADTPDHVMAALGVRVKLISAAVMKAMDAEGTFVALNNIVSQSVPHVHFHVVPRRKGDGLFSARMIWKRVAYKSDAEREAIASRIRAAIAEN